MSDIKFIINKIKSSKAYIAIALVVILIILSVIFRFAYTKISEIIVGIAMKEAMTPKVVLEKVMDKDVTYSVESPGRLKEVYSVDLVARVNGYLQKKLYNDGDFVKKGQTLFVIEQSQYQIAVNEAMAEVKSADAKYKKALNDYKRAKELVEKDYISRSTYDDRVAQKDVALATLTAARSKLADAKRNLSYATIKSPIDGKVGYILINEGNYVTAQSGALAEVVSVDPIYADFSIDSKQFLKDSGGSGKMDDLKVELTLVDGSTYPILGKLDFVNNKIDLSTGTIGLRATFKNPDHVLIPGDFIKARVYAAKPTREIVVPESAVLQDDTGKYVFMVDEEQNAVLKRIRVAVQIGNFWVVERGLKVGDTIITDGALKVQDGKKVKVITKEEYENEQNGENKK